MITRGIIALTLLAAAAGCGSGATTQPSASSQTTAAQPEAPTSSATPTTPTPAASTPAASTPAVPAAKDGQNYKACADGVCQVLIRKKAALNLSGDKFAATVAAGTLKLTDSKGYISLSRNGSDVSRSGGGSAGGMAGGLAAVSWSEQDGPLHIATLTYAEGDAVVVTFTMRK